MGDHIIFFFWKNTVLGNHLYISFGKIKRPCLKQVLPFYNASLNYFEKVSKMQLVVFIYAFTIVLDYLFIYF